MGMRCLRFHQQGCQHCLWRWRPDGLQVNTVCGGKGNMGCKSPKPGIAIEDQAQQTLLSEPKKWMCKFFVQGSCTKGDACEFAHDEAELGTPWECLCGFKNKAANTICGGSGPMG